MTRKILSAALLCVVLVAPAAEAADHVDLALQGLGSGPAEEVKNRIFNTPLTFISPEFRARALEALPEQVRRRKVTGGDLLPRVERVAGPVLRLHGREGDVEVVLFRDLVPQAMLWRGCVLLLSDGLAAPLPDAELAGIVAHEISHPYFMDEMAGARRAQDTTLMRVVELKCDAAAVLTVKLLGLDPTSYLKGIKRIKEIARGLSLSAGGLRQTHPEIHERTRFLERFFRQLGWIPVSSGLRRSARGSTPREAARPQPGDQLLLGQHLAAPLDQQQERVEGLTGDSAGIERHSTAKLE